MNDGWIGVVGAAVGGVIGVLGTLLAQWTAGRREDAHRFTADRRTLYARFHHASTEIAEAARTRAETGPFRRGSKPIVSDELREAAGRDASEILITASDSVGPSVTAMYGALAELVETAAQLTHAPGEASDPASVKWADTYAAFERAQSSFVEAARDDLGVAPRANVLASALSRLGMGVRPGRRSGSTDERTPAP